MVSACIGLTVEKARLNMVGPITEPQGTPDVMGLFGEISPSKSVNCSLLLSRLRAHRIMKGFISAAIRDSVITLKGILSKAFEISRYITAHLIFLKQKSFKKNSTRLVAVFLPVQNPCCAGSLWDMRDFAAICCSMMASMIDRKIGRFDIGRKSWGVLGVEVFGIGVILTLSQSLGMRFSLRHDVK